MLTVILPRTLAEVPMSESNNKPPEHWTPEEQSKIAEAVDSLTSGVDQLRGGLSDTLSSLRRSHDRHRRGLWVLSGILVVVVGLVVATALIGLSSSRNTERIETITNRIDQEQTFTHERVLCPIYRVFLLNDTPEALAQVPEAERENTIRVHAVLREGYNLLKCDQYVSQP